MSRKRMTPKMNTITYVVCWFVAIQSIASISIPTTYSHFSGDMSPNHLMTFNQANQIDTEQQLVNQSSFRVENPVNHTIQLGASQQDDVKGNLRDTIMEALTENYKKYERPPSDGATIVIVNMKVEAMFSVDVRTMDYHMDLLLRQQWNDSRLAWHKIPEFATFTDELASPSLKEKLWLPDLFFRNGQDGYLHTVTLPNCLVRIKPTGEVLYSQKITMRFSCQMYLETFPMDSQTCFTNIGSYGYALHQLKFVWKADDPVELSKSLELSEFETPEEVGTNDCSATYSTATGQYTCLNATFELKRQLGSYLVTTYIPNTLIISVSWLSFWVNIDAAPARIPLGLLSLLGILTQAIGISSTLPRVSYIKAIDIWMISSIVFVASVLVEYALAQTLLRRKKTSESWHLDVKQILHEELARWCTVTRKHQLHEATSTLTTNSYHRNQVVFCEEMEAILTREVIDPLPGSEQKQQQEEALPVLDGKQKTKPHPSVVVNSSRPRLPPGFVESQVDAYSRFLFPACFLMYNCIYWIYYLVLVDRNK